MEQFGPEIRFLMSRESGQKAMNDKIIKGVSVTARDRLAGEPRNSARPRVVGNVRASGK